MSFFIVLILNWFCFPSSANRLLIYETTWSRLKLLRSFWKPRNSHSYIVASRLLIILKCNIQSVPRSSIYLSRPDLSSRRYFPSVVVCPVESMTPKALSHYLIDATIFLPTPNSITASAELNWLPATTKSYPFFSHNDLQGKDSCPEKLYLTTDISLYYY